MNRFGFSLISNDNSIYIFGGQNDENFIDGIITKLSLNDEYSRLFQEDLLYILK